MEILEVGGSKEEVQKFVPAKKETLPEKTRRQAAEESRLAQERGALGVQKDVERRKTRLAREIDEEKLKRLRQEIQGN